VQIGIRLVFPLVSLAIVGLAAAGVHAWQALGPTWSRSLLTAAGGSGLVWTSWSVVAIWPHGLLYSNELWGDPAQAYLRVSDSNYDWGQGLSELRRWQQQQGLANLDVWYFGTDPRIKQPPLHEVPFHLLPVQDPADVLSRVQGNYLAVSTTILYGVVHKSEAHRCAREFLKSLQPVARTNTFLIYDFTGPPDSAAGVGWNRLASGSRPPGANTP
jgi:hypothetical protein